MTTPTAALFNYPIANPLSPGSTPAVGTILSGCSLVFYETGTTTAESVYADGYMTTSLGNIVNANASGQFVPLYLNPAIIYRVQLWSGNNGTGTKLQDIDPYLTQALPSQQAIAQVLYPQTAAELAAGITPIAYYYLPGDVRRYGAVGDGSTDNSAVLTEANLIGISLYFPIGTYAIASAITLTSPLRFDLGAILKPAANTTVTVNCPIDAGPWQIFNVSATGSLITSSGMTAGGTSGVLSLRPMRYGVRIPVEWFGAVGDNVTDDTGPLQNTVNLAYSSNICGVQLQAKQYHTTATIVCNENAGTGAGSFYTPSWFGTDPKKSQICLRGATLGTPALQFVGGSGTQSHAVVQDIGFNGDSNSQGISFEGQCGAKAINCLFDTNFGGIRFYNNLAGSFTEYCRADFCEFTTNCNTPVQYARASGTDSFHGSGLYRCTIVSTTASNTGLINVGAGCFVYNAPLDVQVWVASGSPATYLVNNEAGTGFPVYFHGDLTIEIDGSSLTLAENGPVYFTGFITTENSNVSGGTFVQCEALQLNSDSTVCALGIRKAHTQAGVTGANTLAAASAGQTAFIDVRILGTGYDYRGVWLVINNGGGGNGYSFAQGNQLITNTAGYGAPTATVNPSGQLVLTNASFPASGLMITWAEKSFSSGIAGGTAQANF